MQSPNAGVGDHSKNENMKTMPYTIIINDYLGKTLASPVRRVRTRPYRTQRYLKHADLPASIPRTLK
jgi:hypothetical protein